MAVGISARHPLPYSISRTTYLVPLGLGAGKVLPLGGAIVNAFVEPQVTVYHQGDGVPAFQVFAGLESPVPEEVAQKDWGRSTASIASRRVLGGGQLRILSQCAFDDGSRLRPAVAIWSRMDLVAL